eukprot:TRINITY_DN13035_c0_g1_i4.p1 TRINITY_DN13035_c0_g1~~TRINITY_DN13035_c0_g1_i4.p1  ORF type:complete len:611 (+),score=77.13 TRINITY_DN13035_c0_g1_i4:80-1912(+)
MAGSLGYEANDDMDELSVDLTRLRIESFESFENQPRIKEGEVKPMEVLVSGGSKTVRRGRFMREGTIIQVAIATPLRKNKDKAKQFETWKREVDFQRMVHHPHISEVLKFFTEEDKPVIVTELVEYDLFRHGMGYTWLGKTIPVSEMALFFRQLIKAVKYIHSKRLLHRDLHSGQVLVKPKELHVLLTDFGSAVTFDEVWHDPSKRRCQSPVCAPEMKHASPDVYGPEVDAFGLGWILHEFYHPFLGYTPPGQQQGSGLMAAMVHLLAPLVPGHPVRDMMDGELLKTFKNRISRTEKDFEYVVNRWTIDQLENCEWLRTEFPPAEQNIPSGDPTRDHRVHRFSQLCRAVNAHLSEELPSMSLMDFNRTLQLSGNDWVVLLVDPNNEEEDFITFPNKDTRLSPGQRVIFGVQDDPVEKIEILLEHEDDKKKLRKVIDDDGRVSQDVSVAGQNLVEGMWIREGFGRLNEIELGTKVCFGKSPRLELYRKLKLPLHHGPMTKEVVSFTLDVDCFEFPKSIFEGNDSAVLGHEQVDGHIPLNFRHAYKVNVAGVATKAEGHDAGLQVQWAPGPKTVVKPGDLCLVVRAPTKKLSMFMDRIVTCHSLQLSGLPEA